MQDFDGIGIYEPGTQKLVETYDKSKWDQASWTKVLQRLGHLDSYYDESMGRTVFLGSSLTCNQKGGIPNPGETIFYNGQEEEALGKLSFVLGHCLSPDGKTLAVLLKDGVLLLDVKSSLAAKKLIPRK